MLRLAIKILTPHSFQIRIVLHFGALSLETNILIRQQYNILGVLAEGVVVEHDAEICDCGGLVDW